MTSYLLIYSCCHCGRDLRQKVAIKSRYDGFARFRGAKIRGNAPKEIPFQHRPTPTHTTSLLLAPAAAAGDERARSHAQQLSCMYVNASRAPQLMRPVAVAASWCSV